MISRTSTGEPTSTDSTQGTSTPEQKERQMIKSLSARALIQKERPMFKAIQDQKESQKKLEKKVKLLIDYHEACVKAGKKLIDELKKLERK